MANENTLKTKTYWDATDILRRLLREAELPPQRTSLEFALETLIRAEGPRDTYDDAIRVLTEAAKVWQAKAKADLGTNMLHTRPSGERPDTRNPPTRGHQGQCSQRYV